MQSTFLNNGELNALRNVSFSVSALFASLHTANPGITGANEVTGGSYARQSTTLSAAASSATSNSGQLNFTGMPVVGAPGLTHIGLWDAVSAGNFLWAGPIGTPDMRAFTAATTDIVTAPGSTYSNGQMVDFVDIFDSALPTGVSQFTNYFIVQVSGATFKVSTTSGGSAVDITADGAGLVRRIIPVTVTAGDTVNIAIAALALAKI